MSRRKSARVSQDCLPGGGLQALTQLGGETTKAPGSGTNLQLHSVTGWQLARVLLSGKARIGICHPICHPLDQYLIPPPFVNHRRPGTTASFQGVAVMQRQFWTSLPRNVQHADLSYQHCASSLDHSPSAPCCRTAVRHTCPHPDGHTFVITTVPRSLSPSLVPSGVTSSTCLTLAGRPVDSYDVATSPLTFEPYDEDGIPVACGWFEDRRPTALVPGLGEGARDTSGAGTMVVLVDFTGVSCAYRCVQGTSTHCSTPACNAGARRGGTYCSPSTGP